MFFQLTPYGPTPTDNSVLDPIESFGHLLFIESFHSAPDPYQFSWVLDVSESFHSVPDSLQMHIFCVYPKEMTYYIPY